MVIPAAVARELHSPGTPELVRKQIESPPAWLEIRRVSLSISPDLVKLDQGEQEAIALARELAADALIIDERAGRRAASRLGITVIGTLGVLEEAPKLGLLDLPAAIAKLQMTTFRADSALLRAMLDRNELRIQIQRRQDGY